MIMDNQIMVSVYCLAYNHEKYIRQTLDGFVKQKTNFKYEVIIHDDASQDSTQKIIKEYVDMYPQLFIPILQKENQFSRKVSIICDYIFPNIRGKYVAICEGDDYWTDPYKLQKQVDVLEKNPECFFVTHRVGRVKENGEYLDEGFPMRKLKISPGILEQNAFMEKLMKNGYLFQTSSHMYRKELFNIYVEKKQEFLSDFPGDFAMLCLAASHGSCFFIEEEMSKYRVMAQESWTSRMAKNRTMQIIRYEKSISGLKSLDTYTGKKYQRFISYAIGRQKVMLYSIQGQYRYLLKNMQYFSGNKEKIKYLILGMIDTILPNMFAKLKARRYR